jgi:DNA-binding NarL/FixJ family response regulator
MSENDARECLRCCLRLFHQLRDTAGADACLRALAAGSWPNSASRDTNALSRRERQVAAPVAAGLSNREIGEALPIAQRAARGHVTNILAKLGLHSRAQIATWFSEHRRPHS